MNTTENKIYENLLPIITDLSFELVKVDISERSGQKTITIYIDGDSPITIENCETVHRLIDGKMDELDPTNGKSYNLNVSSLGLDWNIESERDFDKHMGKILTAKFYAPIDGEKSFVGILIEFDENSFVLQGEKQEKRFEKKQVCKLEKYFDFTVRSTKND